MVCQKCGAQLFEDDAFCGECGAKVEKQEDTFKKRTCPKCGAELLNDDVFCGSCGTRLEEDNKPKGKTCRTCGAELLEGDMFCGVCGTRVNEKESEPVEEPPKHVDVNPDAKKEKKELYRLTINREKSFVGSLVALKIRIDEKEVGKVKNGATLFTSVPEGSHKIYVNDQEIATLNITADTTAEVAFAGPNTFTIKNVEVGGKKQALGENKGAKKSLVSSTKSCWTAVIIFPIISVLLAYFAGLIIHPVAYGFLIGYAILNIFGIKKHESTPETKSLMTQNIIIMVIAIVEMIVAALLTV